MKTITKQIGRLALVAGLMFAKQAPAAVLPVPYYAQRSFYAAADTNHLHNISDWCWDASSEMVLNTPLSASYPGTFFDQDTIAAYGSQGSNHWNYLYGSAARYTDTAGVTHPALKGIDMILKNFGSLSTKRFTRALTSAELQTEIDAGRPAVARIGWGAGGVGGGGHFVVLYGFDGTVIDINDPWPDTGPNMQVYSSWSSTSVTNKYHGSLFQWTHTLTLGASLDVCFLIDTTGSMGSTIASVKAALINITSNIFALFPDARIAVKDFKDNPAYVDGDSAYLDQVDAPFTTNRTIITSALNTLSAAGGGDTPEAHWTALINTMNGVDQSGAVMGTWRTNPTPRIIIIASDTHGHDPVEPWAGGFSLGDVIAKATTPGKEISIYGLAASSDAVADFDVLAAGTGGAEFDTGYTGVAAGILQVVNQAAQSTRHPQGVVASARPKFTFEPGHVGMGGVPASYVIQILKSNAVTGVWDLFVQSPVTNNTFTPGAALPVGNYQWRLGAQQSASTILSPVGDVLGTVPAGLIFEDAYTAFARGTFAAGPATMLTPTTSSSTPFQLLNGVIPSNLRKLAKVGKLPQPFTWNAGLFATSYVLTIQVQNAAGTWSVLKTVTVAPPASNPSATHLSANVTGLFPGLNYRWSIQSVGEAPATPARR